jgi:hypothetical protein
VTERIRLNQVRMSTSPVTLSLESCFVRLLAKIKGKVNLSLLSGSIPSCYVIRRVNTLRRTSLILIFR